MALSADTNLVYEIGERSTVPVKATSQIYLGSAVGYTSGYAQALVAGDDFAGFALENKLGGAADGDVNCAVTKSGQVELAITSIAVTDIGKPVYASADGTFTLTQSTNSKIGTVSRWVSTGTAIVRYQAQGAGADLTGVTVLTDSSGGATADGTIGIVTAPTALGATLTDSTGDSGTHDDELADGLTATSPAAITNYAAVVNMTDPVAKAEGEAVSAALATLEDEVTALRVTVAACVTDLTVQNQNDSDLAQKVIELVTAQAANRTAIVALTDAVKELSTKVNETINALK